MKYLKLFNNHNDYSTDIATAELPNVSYCEALDEVHYNTDPRIIVTLNVTSTTDATKLTDDDTSAAFFSEMWIDDVKQNSVLVSYTFNTTGKHTVKYKLVDPTTIGEYAFYECSNIVNIIIPNSVTTIGNSAFYNCTGLTRITIPKNVTSIGNYAFGGCTSLVSINSNVSGECIIPKTLTSIGNSFLYKSNGITRIVVDNSNPNYDSRNNCNAIIETSTNKLIKGCINTVIPNTVVSIGTSAFFYLTDLTSIVIPNSVTSIGNSAFGYCTNLTTVNIPNSVTTIEPFAFMETNITSITIPDSVTTLGAQAFAMCENLTSVTIPNSVTIISDSLFNGCTSLTKVNSNVSGECIIPDTVTTLKGYAFRNCSFTSVTIGSSVTTLNYGVFENCTGLETITSLATTAPTVQYDTFKNVKTGGTLYVQSGSTGYNAWMDRGSYYLGKYSWTKVEQ